MKSSLLGNVEDKVQSYRERVVALQKSIKKLEFDNEALVKKSKENKRARTIINLYKEMESQDMIIETLRELIGDKKADDLIPGKMDEGPKRVRPPTREELYMVLRESEDQFNALEKEYFKLLPNKNLENIRNKACQTEDLLDGEESVDISILKEGQADKSLNKKINEIKRSLKLQQDCVRNIKELIDSKGANGQKVFNLKDDLVDLKNEIATMDNTLDSLDKRNAELKTKIDLIKDTKNSTNENLQEQLKDLEVKHALMGSENKKFEEEGKNLDGQINGLMADANSKEIADKLIWVKDEIRDRDRNIDELRILKNAEEKKVEDLENYNAKLEIELSGIESAFEGKIVQQTKDNNTQVREVKRVIEQIEKLKKLVKEARVNEVSLLEEVEALTEDVARKEEKASALVLLNKYKKGSNLESEDDTLNKVRLEFDSRISHELLEHTRLKRQIREARDLLFMLRKNDVEMNQLPPRKDEQEDVNSMIESFDTFTPLTKGGWSKKSRGIGF